MTKRKVLAKNKTEMADLLNKLDGLGTGINRKTNRQVLKNLMTVDIAATIQGGYRSPLVMLRAQSLVKAKVMIAKKKKAKKKK